MAIGTRMQQRRATAAVWNTWNGVLAAGELGVTTDTGIIKIGDGVNTWTALNPAFSSQYLPLLGKAADSDLLDGINSSGFYQLADATTAATADKLAKRDGSGRLKAATGASTDDVVNYVQMVAADTAAASSAVVVGRQELISRTVTAAFTFAAADVGSIVVINNAAYTTFAGTIPTNASVAIAVGSFIDIRCGDKGPVTLTPAGGVTLTGTALIYGQGGVARILKTATDAWLVLHVQQSPGPLLRRKIKTAQTLATSAFTKLRLDGADSGTALFSNNADTLGTGEQYASGTDLYKVNCRRSGWYDVKAQMTLAEGVDDRVYVSLRINNILQQLGNGVSRGGVLDTGPGFAAYVPLNVGDYVEVYGFHEGAGTSTVSDTTDSHSVFEWAWQRPL